MGAQTVISRALIQDYAVRAATAEVDANPVWIALGQADPADMCPGARWGIPVHVIKAWIRHSLVEGDYATASMWSMAIRVRVPSRPSTPRPVTLAKASDRVSRAGVIMFVSECELDRIRGGEIRGEWMLDTNDPDSLADWFALSPR